MSTQNLDSTLTDVIEKLKREAHDEGFAQGWRAAVTAFTKAVSQMGEPENGPVITIQSAPATNVLLSSSSSEKKLPVQGSAPWFVLEAVKKNPGLTTLELVQNVVQNHSIAENSVRTSIFRMKERDFIVARHNRWYPV